MWFGRFHTDVRNKLNFLSTDKKKNSRVCILCFMLYLALHQDMLSRRAVTVRVAYGSVLPLREDLFHSSVLCLWCIRCIFRKFFSFPRR